MVIVDTGFWLALANANDSFHERAVKALAALRDRLITTWPVMTEACHLLLSRLGHEAQIHFLASHRQGAFQVFALEDKHIPQMEKLMKKYKDLPMDLADASLVILAEHLGRGLVLSTDERGFQAYRFKNHRPFQNLLLP